MVVVVLVEEWVALLNLVVMVGFFAWLVVILIRWWTEYFEYSEFFVWIANSYVKWISFIISNYFVYIIFPKFIILIPTARWDHVFVQCFIKELAVHLAVHDLKKILVVIVSQNSMKCYYAYISYMYLWGST